MSNAKFDALLAVVVFLAAIPTIAPATTFTQITFSPADDQQPAWSPLGDKIAFTTNRNGYYEIYTIRVSDGYKERLTESTGWTDSGACWTPDGTMIIFQSDREAPHRIYRMNSDGSGEVKIVEDDGVHPACSPDGVTVAYIRDVNKRIARVPLMGGSVTEISTGSYEHHYPCWSPDGSKIACRYSPPSGHDVYSMPSTGGPYTQLTTSPGDDGVFSEYSPNGTWIAFSSYRSGGGDIYVMDSRGESYGLWQITTDSAADLRPSWSPDGRSIVFHSSRSGNNELWIASDLPMWPGVGDHKVYVANQADNTVSAIDEDSRAILATIPVADQPNCVTATTTNRVYVAHTNSDSIAVIDVWSDTVIDWVVVDGITWDVAVSNDNTTAYATLYTDRKIAVIDLTTNTVTNYIETPDHRPQFICMSSDDNWAYVSLRNFSGTSNLMGRINAGTLVLETMPVETASKIWPMDLVERPSSGMVYLANGGDDGHTVSIIDPSAMTRVGEIDLGKKWPTEIALSKDGARLYTANYYDASVSFINAGTNSLIGNVNVSTKPWGVDVSPDGDYVFVSIEGGVASGHTVEVIEVATMSGAGSIEVGQGPFGVCATTLTEPDTIEPVVTVLSPNGGQTWYGGDTEDITWTATDANGIVSVSIYYSVDGGSNYSVEASGQDNDGVYEWIVPNTPTATALVKVVAYDPSLNAGEDVSDGMFAIADGTPPVVTVLSPNGGESWNAGDTENVTWTATDENGVDSVSVYYSVNGGSSYDLIASGETNDGVYPWSIPNSPTDSALVRVVAYDPSINTGEDVSDILFSIEAAGPCLILGDTTWTLTGSPYIVDCEIHVGNGSTLTIDPGVEVRFDPGMAIVVGDSTVGSGTLVARGTAVDSIRFTSNEASPQPGDYGGIQFMHLATDAAYDSSWNYDNGSILEYCVVEYAGPGVTCISSSPGIERCSIWKNSNPSSGGGIYCNASALRLVSSAIEWNDADGFGGGFFCQDSSSLVLLECTISNNRATSGTSSGGGLAAFASFLTARDCTLSANFGNIGGGGMYTGSSTLDLSMCHIVGNSASFYGAGLDDSYSVGTISETVIDGNWTTSSAHGGGVALHESLLDLVDCSISNNSSSEHGGGAFCDGGSPSFVRCAVKDNQSKSGGGIWAGNIYAGVFAGEVRACSLLTNTATLYGGGLYLEDSSAQVDSCIIIDNESSFCGGGLTLWGSGAALSNCCIEDNQADRSGGGLFCSATDSAVIVNCSVASNNAGCPDSTGYGGGVACVGGTTTSFERCDVVSNTTEGVGGTGQGAGFWCKNSSPTLLDCSISLNDTWRYGGGMFLNEGSCPTIADCHITDNYAGAYGGGIYSDQSSPSLMGTHVLNNDCGAAGGGGLYFYGVLATPQVTDCYIAGNTCATEGGGVLVTDGANMTCSGSVIAENTAGTKAGAVYSFSNGWATLTECTVVSNVSGEGFSGALMTGNFGHIAVSESNIFSNEPYAIYTMDPDSLSARHNWWGVTDTSAVRDSIYDCQDNPNGGNCAHIVPILLAPSDSAPGQPDPVSSVVFKTDSTFAEDLGYALCDSLIYIELAGTGTNPYCVDQTSVYLTSDTDPVGIQVALTETGDSTGVYRGLASVAFGDSVSDDVFDRIAAQDMDVVRAYSRVDTAMSDSLIVSCGPPTVTVLMPNGGEVLEACSNYVITWAACHGHGVDSVSIYYSTDGGGGYELIASGEANDSTYTWMVPNTPTDSALVRVVAYDPSLSYGEDTTDGLFTISPDTTEPTVTVLSPNGGEAVDVCHSFDITWTATDACGVDSVSIYYSMDGGGSYSLIASGEPNDALYPWAVPFKTTVSALVKIIAYDNGLNTGEDASDSLFVMQVGLPTGSEDLADGADVWIYGPPDSVGGEPLCTSQSTVGLSTGDFDGDGYDDIAIGGPSDGTWGNCGMGMAYVIFGRSPARDSLDLYTDRDLVIVGSEAPDESGGWGLAAGDINGDGIDDLIVGARGSEGYNNTKPQRTGETYVILGGPRDSLGTELQMPEDADVAIYGIDGEDISGHSVGAGDINGDGMDDVIIGAPWAAGPLNDRSRAGEVYVVYGAETDSLDPIVELEFDADFVLYGAEAGDSCGLSVTAADFDGDGFDDLLVGAPGASGWNNHRLTSGEAYVIYGSSSLPSQIDLAVTWPDVWLVGADPADALGFAVCTGDHSADGKADIVLGAPESRGKDDSGVRRGEVHVVYGDTRLELGNFIDLASDFDRVIYGADDGDKAGWSVAIGQVGGDIAEDLIIGAPGSSSKGNTRVAAGETHLVSGRVGGATGERDLARPLQVVFWGAESGDKSGTTVACADFNGDGLADVIIGAYEADGPGNSRNHCGEAYVLSGNELIVPVPDDWPVSDPRRTPALLSQNYPNPFRRNTTINYRLPRDSFVELAIYDIAGRRVRTLVCAHSKQGWRSASWDGKDDDGRSLPAGVYLCRIDVGGIAESRKVLFVR